MMRTCLIPCLLLVTACARPSLDMSDELGGSTAGGETMVAAPGNTGGGTDASQTPGTGANMDPGGSAEDSADTEDGGGEMGAGPPTAEVPGGAGPGPAQGVCGSAAVCANAALLGELNGRDASQQFQTSGTGSAVFTVRIENPNLTTGGSCLSFTGGFNDEGLLAAMLQVPPGTDYDLFIRGSEDDACALQEESIQQSDAPESAEATWQWTNNGSTGNGFGGFPNLGGTGGQDSCVRVMTVEVLHMSGECDAEWTLTVDASN